MIGHLAIPADLFAPAAVALAAAGMCAFVWLADPTHPGAMTPLCPSKTLLGVTCPGCGSARMLYSILHGDWSAALHFNALGVIALGLLMWSYLAWTLAKITGFQLPRWDQWRWSPAAMLLVVAIWFIIRNLPMAPFASLRV